MSLYEALALVALAGIGSFAFHLYRQDTRPKTPGGPKSDPPPSRSMFGRAPQGQARDERREKS